MLSILWFFLELGSSDPHFLGWIFVFIGLTFVAVIDVHGYFGTGIDNLNLGVRIVINFVVGLIGLALSGAFVLALGPPSPKGTFSVFLTITAFMAMLSVVRIGLNALIVISRLDWNGVASCWFKSRKSNKEDVSGDSPTHEFLEIVDLPMDN